MNEPQTIIGSRRGAAECFRTARIEAGDVNAEKREVLLSFASEEPVERYDWASGKSYLEILDHSSPNSADFSRLNNGGALLREHDTNQQVGVVVAGTARIDADRKSRALVRFSRSPLGEQEFQDVRDGIRTLVSVRYVRTDMIRTEVVDGIEKRWFRWIPYEISTVAIPADPTVGVGRGAAAEECVDAGALSEDSRSKPGDNNQLDEKTMSNTNIEVTENDILVKERARIREIQGVAEQLSRDFPHLAERWKKLASDAVDSGASVESFKAGLLPELPGAVRAKPITAESIGVSEREVRSYSLLRAIQNCIATGSRSPSDGLEREISDAIAKRAQIQPAGFFVPFDLPVRVAPRGWTRDLVAGTAAQGGYTVATIVQLPVIELLRNRAVTARLGVQVLSGLEGNVAIPRQTGAATAYSLAEQGAITASNQTLDQIALSPKRVGVQTNYSKQLLFQSSVDVENFVRDDLLQVIAIKHDKLILEGSGTSNEPYGIANTTGIGTVTFGGAPTFAKVVAFETALALANADVGAMAYVTTPAVRGAWKTTPKIGTTYPVFLWEPGNFNDGSNDGLVNGYRAAATNQVSNDVVYFGNWRDAILALWGGLDVVVDPYTSAGTATIRIIVNSFMDVGVRHVGSFCKSVDAGNQS